MVNIDMSEVPEDQQEAVRVQLDQNIQTANGILQEMNELFEEYNLLNELANTILVDESLIEKGRMCREANEMNSSYDCVHH